MSETAVSAKSSIVSVLALIIALIAVGLAAWVLIKESKSSQTAQSEETASAFTGDAADNPEGTICEAFNLVRTGVQTNTNLQPPGGPKDVTGSMAVAANARLSLVEGGQYLLARLQPDTSQDLTDAIRTFANRLMDIGAHSIAGIPNSDPAQSARLKEADASSAEIADLCK